jgi:glyoxylase-like metal-dependent hydrolase (beta-lactamase superfamily II)
VSLPGPHGEPHSGEPPAAISGQLAREATRARAHQLADGVWGLQLPLCYESVASVNAYLLAAADGWVLVDCGSALDPGWDALERALGLAGVAPNEVALLVLSHAHVDHAGLTQVVAERTGCAVAVGPGPHPLIDRLRDPAIPLEVRRARGTVEGVPTAWVDRMVDDLPGNDRGYPEVTPDRTLAPGELIASTSGPWEVHSAAGHSADQIVLWNASSRALISADMALGGPASYLEWGTRPDPHGDQLATLDRAIALDPELILPGHGRPVTEAAQFLADCRRKVADRVRAIEDLLDALPRSGFEIAAAITPPGADAGHWQRSLAEALSVLEHLELHGVARHVIDDGGTRCWLAGGR